ncbi:MAG: murein hydrolase activator EnvC family protein, partial [Acetobacteraceae bacterium]
AREFAPYLPVIERLSLDPAATLLAVPAPPAQALRGLLVLQAIATGVEREAKALRADEARVNAIAAKITRAETRLKAAKARQAAEGAALDEEITATRTAEQAAISQRAEAEAAAADEAARAKTLQGAIAAIIEATRQEEAARQAAAARQAEAARRAAAAHRQEQLALARPEVPTVAPPPLAPPPPPPPGQPSGPPLQAPPPKRAPGAPVVGELVSRVGAAPPAGPAPGIRYQAAPGAHVLAPCAGTVEFAAPFHSYGQVVILDCGKSYRIVLAGMDRLLVRSGMEVSAGDAVGVMAEWNPGSSEPRPTLYLELHHGREVINPLPWLHGRG